MSNWPKYESHKIVQAAKIVGIERSSDGATVTAIWVRPAGERNDSAKMEKFEPDVVEMGMRATVGDYAVIYGGGFKSISPAKEFEDGYTPIPG